MFNNSPSSNMTNDILALSARTLEFHHSGAVWGNSLTVTVGINAFSADAGPLAMNFQALNLGGDISIDSNDGTGWGYTLNCETILNGHTLTVYAANLGSAQFGTPFAGNGQVIFAAGTNYLNPKNGMPGPAPIRVSAGYLGLGYLSNAAITNLLEIDGGGTVFLVADSAIASTATVIILGGGQLLLDGHTDAIENLILTNYSSDAVASTVDATGEGLLGLTVGITASVDNDHVNPIIKGRLNLIGFCTFDISGGPEPGLEIQAAIGGNGFNKTGDGGLRLSGNNTFSGDVEATEGQILAETSTTFGQGGPTHGVHLAGGLILLDGVIIDAEPLYVDAPSDFDVALAAVGPSSWTGPVTLNATLVATATDTMDFSGSISGTGGLRFEGSGSLQLDGSTGNTFTGPLSVCDGILEFAKPSGVNAYSGSLQVGPPCGGTANTCEARWLNSYQNVGATLTLYANGLVNLNNQNEDFGSVTFNGGEVDTGSGQFAIYAPLTVNPAGTTAVINGYLGLPPGDDRVFIVGDGAADPGLQVNAVVFGNPGTYFVKQGAGTMALAGANTFNAPTLLEEGILDVNSGSALGTDAGLIIFNGATLRLDGAGNFGGGFEAVGAGVGGTHGAVEVLPNSSFSFAGSVLLDAATTLNVGVSAGLGLDGSISGTGPLTQTGSGSLVLAGGSANTYSGDTVVLGGTLNAAKSFGVAAVPGNLVLGPGPSGPVATVVGRLLQSGGIGGGTTAVNGNSLFDLNGYNQTLATLNLNDGGSVQTGVGLLSFPSGGAVNVGITEWFWLARQFIHQWRHRPAGECAPDLQHQSFRAFLSISQRPGAGCAGLDSRACREREFHPRRDRETGSRPDAPGCQQHLRRFYFRQRRHADGGRCATAKPRQCEQRHTGRFGCRGFDLHEWQFRRRRAR